MQAEWVKTGSVMGDVFSNISDSTIINRSKVEHSFHRAEQLADAESARALVEVARIVQEAGREDGERLLAEFMSKLDEKRTKQTAIKGPMEWPCGGSAGPEGHDGHIHRCSKVVCIDTLDTVEHQVRQLCRLRSGGPQFEFSVHIKRSGSRRSDSPWTTKVSPPTMS